jgi:hypothetical protein
MAMTRSFCRVGVVALVAFCALGPVASAQETTPKGEPVTKPAAGGPSKPAEGQSADAEAAELAKKLTNPVASLISVPFQSNFDFNMGPGDDGWKYQLNFQPVIPISLGPDWNVISRTILPVIYQDDAIIPGESQAGLGDITQSFFFSPGAPSFGFLIWGVGPVFLVPTATDDLLGTEKFGIGPTAVALTQTGGWTVGVLANHVWSVAGNSDRADVSSTFLQPFISYTTKDAVSFTLNTESTYDWESEQWSVPINVQVTKIFRFGKLPVSLGGGVRYWAESPRDGPEDVGFRLLATFLLPK